jgi:predicted PurR-regulated permease PerM
MKEITYSKSVYWILFVLLLVVSLIVLRPFIYPVIGGMLLAYIFYPLYKKIFKKLKRDWVAALIISLSIILIFTILMIIIADLFANEAYVTYVLLKQKVSSITTINIVCNESSIKCSILNFYSKTVGDPRVSIYITNALGKATTYAIDWATNFIVSIPQLVLDLFIMFFVMYYTFKDGETLVRKVWLIFPLKKNHQEKIEKRVTDIINSTIYGEIVVSIIQGATALIGYYVVGIHSSVILGIVTAFAALIPTIGTALVWVPASLVLISDGLAAGNNTTVFGGIGLMLYGLLVVSTIDNLIRPKLVGSKAQLHPALVLLGVLGGLAMFGIIGLFLGPLILALFVTFIEIYEETEFE